MASEAPNQDHPPELTMKYSERCYCGDNLLSKLFTYAGMK